MEIGPNKITQVRSASFTESNSVDDFVVQQCFALYKHAD